MIIVAIDIELMRRHAHSTSLNRCVMHRRDPFDAASRRLLHRTEVLGAAPVAAPVAA